ncbi:hypothetical protein EI94DRAFT_1731317 [Lactarius quietus]|nr:hypothetical protein EI94DRAFT_1731317 [Lactarius quietus]
MGSCFSKTPTDSPPDAPTRSVTQHPPIELQQRSAPPDPPLQRRGATSVPANPIQLDQTDTSIPAPIPPQFDGTPSPKPPPRSNRSNYAPVLRMAASESPYDSARIGGWPASEGEPSRKQLPEFEISNPSHPSHHLHRSFSMDTPGPAPPPSFRDRGQRDKNRIGTVPDPQGGSRAVVKRAATRGHNTGSFVSTMRGLLPDGFRFRILVLGKRQSGKSTLINSVFNVDMAAAPRNQHGDADINVGFNLDSNRYLVVHEYPGFESGDAQSLPTIRAFISSHTDVNCSVSERLHAIWICVPISDANEGGLDEGVKKILSMKKVPVLIVFTKFDVLVSQVQFDITRGEMQRNEDPRARAHATRIYEDSCRSLFHKDPKHVPAVIFSEKRAYRGLIGELTSTTHGFFKASSHKSTGRPSSSQAQQPVQPMAPAHLAWSVAQRVNHDIIIQASIEVGRSRYWRSLGSSRDFTNHTLESCVRVIHEDIVNVWNFDDREGYLLGRQFTAMMTDLAGDMVGVGSSDVSPNLYLNWTSTLMAPWTNGLYQNTHKNIRCIMAYIVDLTVILYGLFLTSRSVFATEARSAVQNYESCSKAQIHGDIRSFVAQTPLTYQDKDIMLEKIIDLIKQNCGRTSSQHSS